MHAFVTSILDYCNGLLSGVRLDKLQRVQNAAACLIFGVRWTETITPYLRRLHWLPIRQRFSLCLEFPPYVCEIKGLFPQVSNCP